MRAYGRGLRQLPALLALAGLLGCSANTAPVVVSPSGLCWPTEGDAAYQEYLAHCGQDGSLCPATTAWRVRLRTLAVQVPPCQP
jgi:hypothetical protein